MKVLEIFKDKIDKTIKTVFITEDYTKTIDVDFLPNTTQNDIVRINAFTKNNQIITIDEIIPSICGAVVFTGDLEKKDRRTNKERLIIEITSKYGDITCNENLLTELNNNIFKLKEILGYKEIAFKLNLKQRDSLERIYEIATSKDIPLFITSENTVDINVKTLLKEFIEIMQRQNSTSIFFKDTIPAEIKIDIKNNINFIKNRIFKTLKECSNFGIPVVLTSSDGSVTEEAIKNYLLYLYNQGFTEQQVYFEPTLGIDVNELDSITNDEELSAWKVQHKIYELQRRDALDWDTCFMSIARLIAMRSKDPHRQVGACIVGRDNKILSLGYNGAPVGINDDEFPWGKIGDDLETKHMYVCHAEANAISNYNGNNSDMHEATIYVDLFPCNECAKKIIQAGISEVVYLSDKNAMKPSTIAAKRMFDKVGIKYRQLAKEKQRELTLDLVVKK